MLAYISDYISTEIRATIVNYITSVLNLIPGISIFGIKDAVVGKINSGIDSILSEEYFAGKTMQDMDWDSVVDEDQRPMIDLMLQNLKGMR